MDVYGLTKNKKEIYQCDLENYEEMPEKFKENIDISGSFLKKLERKTRNYQGNFVREKVNFALLFALLFLIHVF